MKPVCPFPDEAAQIGGCRKLFVGGLPANVTDAMLRHHFGQVCPILIRTCHQVPNMQSQALSCHQKIHCDARHWFSAW
jgi:hypothetical protein